MANGFTSAGTVVEDIIVYSMDPEQPFPSLPKISNLVRTANRVRQAQRPSHPQDLDFDLVDDFIPEGKSFKVCFVHVYFSGGEGKKDLNCLQLCLKSELITGFYFAGFVLKDAVTCILHKMSSWRY